METVTSEIGNKVEQNNGGLSFSTSLPLPNASLLVRNLKELDIELNLRNSAALSELNRQIDELSEIPIDSSSLPRYKDGIQFTSPPASLAAPEVATNSPNPYKSTSGLGNDVFKQKYSEIEGLIQADKTREALDEKLENILNLQKPYPMKYSTGADTPIFPMDFGDDSIAHKLAQQSFILPNDQVNHSVKLPAPSDLPNLINPQGRTSAYNKNLIDFSNRLASIQNMTSEITFQTPSQSQPVVVEKTLYNDPLFTEQKADSLLDPGKFDPANFNSNSLPTAIPSTAPVAIPPAARISLTEQTLDSNRAIIDALRTLQDRVGKLENEKASAKQKIYSLEQELATTRSHLLHEQQMNQRAFQSHPIEAKTAGSSAKSPEYRTSLPIPARGSENTLQGINDARQKIGDLNAEFDRIQQLGEKVGKETAEILLASPSFSPIFSSATSKSEAATKKIFGDILEKHSLIESPPDQNATTSNQSPSYSGSIKQEAPKLSFKKAWEKVDFQNPKERESKASSIEREIKKLETELAKENVSHGRQLSHDPQIIKEKVFEKIKADSLKNPAVKKSEDPRWKTTERRSRSVIRDTVGPSNSASPLTHTRKKAPINAPVVSSTSREDDQSGREMPFIVGRNTGKSFSVTANLQRVFSLLKSHNSELCSVCSKKHHNSNKECLLTEPSKPVHVLDRQDHTRRASVKKNSLKLNRSPSKLKKSPTTSKLEITADDLKKSAGNSSESLFQILGIIEAEHRDAKEQYSRLVKQYESVSNSMASKLITESAGAATLKAIGEDLRHIIQSMDAKSEQITILRDIISSSQGLKQKNEKMRKRSSSNREAIPKRYTMDTATSRSRNNDPHWATHRARSQSPGRAMASLSLLKSSFKVQNALGETV